MFCTVKPLSKHGRLHFNSQNIITTKHDHNNGKALKELVTTSLRDGNVASFGWLTRPINPVFKTSARDHASLEHTAKNSNKTISKVPLRIGHFLLGSFSGGLGVLLEHECLQRLQIPGTLVLLHLLAVVEKFESRVRSNVRLGACRLAGGAVYRAHFHPGLTFQRFAQLLPCGCQVLTVAAPGGIKLDEPQSVLLLELVRIGCVGEGHHIRIHGHESGAHEKEGEKAGGLHLVCNPRRICNTNNEVNTKRSAKCSSKKAAKTKNKALTLSEHSQNPRQGLHQTHEPQLSREKTS